MSKYLIEFNAVVGRKKADVAENDAGASLHQPVQLKYFGVVEAASVEAAHDQVVLYRDPGFVTSVVGVTELLDNTETFSTLTDKLKLATLITEL